MPVGHGGVCRGGVVGGAEQGSVSIAQGFPDPRGPVNISTVSSTPASSSFFMVLDQIIKKELVVERGIYVSPLHCISHYTAWRGCIYGSFFMNGKLCLHTTSVKSQLTHHSIK